MAFGKKQDKFFELLLNMAKNLNEAANYLAENKNKQKINQKEFFEHIKSLEVKGDGYIKEMIKELNGAFITPIEREDILNLGIAIDDVLDGLEHYAGLVDIYSVTKPDEYMAQFAELILESVTEIEYAVEKIAQKKLPAIHEHTLKIKDVETRGDSLLRISLKELLSSEKDVMKVITTKEMYETLEKITDDCQNVAKILETIVMKNA